MMVPEIASPRVLPRFRTKLSGNDQQRDGKGLSLGALTFGTQ